VPAWAPGPVLAPAPGRDGPRRGSHPHRAPGGRSHPTFAAERGQPASVPQAGPRERRGRRDGMDPDRLGAIADRIAAGRIAAGSDEGERQGERHRACPNADQDPLDRQSTGHVTAFEVPGRRQPSVRFGGRLRLI
jgi:hypothetical protein